MTITIMQGIDTSLSCEINASERHARLILYNQCFTYNPQGGALAMQLPDTRAQFSTLLSPLPIPFYMPNMQQHLSIIINIYMCSYITLSHIYNYYKSLFIISIK